jgi:hypothetical protein
MLWTDPGTLTSSITTELNGLADNAAALVTTAVSNDGSDERKLYAMAGFVLGTWQDAKGSVLGTDTLSLLIVPEMASATVFTSAIASGIANSYIARYVDGSAVTWDAADGATTAIEIVTRMPFWIPPTNFKWGLLNRTDGQLAASGNVGYLSILSGKVGFTTDYSAT